MIIESFLNQLINKILLERYILFVLQENSVMPKSEEKKEGKKLGSKIFNIKYLKHNKAYN